jgi:hypothetical protein
MHNWRIPISIVLGSFIIALAIRSPDLAALAQGSPTGGAYGFATGGGNSSVDDSGSSGSYTGGANGFPTGGGKASMPVVAVALIA